MTDHRTNADIEDVLSSIRRLVSDDIRPVPQPAVQPAPLASRPKVPKLVLTSALRVDTVRPPVGPEPEIVMTPPAAAPPEGDAGLSARLAELETLLAAQDPEPYDDEHQDASVVGWTVTPEAWPETVQEAPFVSATGDPGDDAVSLDDAAQAEAPDLNADAPDTSPHLDAPAPEDFGDDDDRMPLDEAFIREIVRDVLREELQGAMGERVTRNLRKLIRAEIARALTARGIA